MKILFDHPSPFLLAHGGFQTQIEQTKRALEAIGVKVDFLRWWDSGQSGDLIHFFSAAPMAYLKLARLRQLPVVMTTLLTATCNRSHAQLRRQKCLTRLILALPGGEGVKDQLLWRSYRNCAQNVVGIEAEKQVLEIVYGVPSERISVVPLGLSEGYLRAGSGSRNEAHLISPGTITQRKNSVALAKLALAARSPILFVGKPYDFSDPYWISFQKLIDGEFVRYHPHVESEEEMIRLLQAARGFVLMSDYENWCLAAHEAAACGLPLLVPDQKWSRERFGETARYFSGLDETRNGEALASFYRDAPKLRPPQVNLEGWDAAARKLQALYERHIS